MVEEIKNKIDDAGLITLDVSDLMVSGKRKELDLSIFLDQGLVQLIKY